MAKKKKQPTKAELIAESVLEREDDLRAEVTALLSAEWPDIAAYCSWLILRDCTEDGKMPAHYEWECGPEYWDSSGELREDGVADEQQSVWNFLENEYTGAWTPTFVSGHGKSWTTYGDLFDTDVSELWDYVVGTAGYKLYSHDGLTSDEEMEIAYRLCEGLDFDDLHFLFMSMHSLLDALEEHGHFDTSEAIGAFVSKNRHFLSVTAKDYPSFKESYHSYKKDRKEGL